MTKCSRVFLVTEDLPYSVRYTRMMRSFAYLFVIRNETLSSVYTHSPASITLNTRIKTRRFARDSRVVALSIRLHAVAPSGHCRCVAMQGRIQNVESGPSQGI